MNRFSCRKTQLVFSIGTWMGRLLPTNSLSKGKEEGFCCRSNHFPLCTIPHIAVISTNRLKRIAHLPFRFALYLTFISCMLCSCSEQSKYQILTFFFTGVPPLEEPVEAVKEKPGRPQPDQNGLHETPHFYSHPLWTAGICDPCHLTNSDFTIPGVVSRSDTKFKSGGGIPGKLVRPQNMLCLKCHRDKSPLRALEDNLWLHNTAAKGDCLECHDQHQSRIPHILKREKSLICMPCHEKGAFWKTPAHLPGKPCMDCHNAHIGKNRNLLTAEFHEVKTVVKDIPGHPELNNSFLQQSTTETIRTRGQQ